MDDWKLKSKPVVKLKKPIKSCVLLFWGMGKKRECGRVGLKSKSTKSTKICEIQCLLTGLLRTCNGAEYQVKNFLSMPIYAFYGAILGVFLLVVTL